MAPERVAAEAGKRRGKAADARHPRRDEVRENVHPGLRLPGRQRPRLVPSRFAHASAPRRRLPQPPRRAFQRHRARFFFSLLPLYRLRRPARVARLVFRRGGPPRFRHPRGAAQSRGKRRLRGGRRRRRVAPSRPSRPRRPPRPSRQDGDPVGTVVAGLGRAAIRGSRPERDERRQRVRRRRRGDEPTPAERDARRRRVGRGGGGDDGGVATLASAFLLGRRRQNRRFGRFPHRDERSRGGRHRRGSRRRVRSVRRARALERLVRESRASRRSRRRRRRRRFRRESRALLKRRLATRPSLALAPGHGLAKRRESLVLRGRRRFPGNARRRRRVVLRRRPRHPPPRLGNRRCGSRPRLRPLILLAELAELSELARLAVGGHRGQSSRAPRRDAAPAVRGGPRRRRRRRRGRVRVRPDIRIRRVRVASLVRPRASRLPSRDGRRRPDRRAVRAFRGGDAPRHRLASLAKPVPRGGGAADGGPGPERRGSRVFVSRSVAPVRPRRRPRRAHAAADQRHRGAARGRGGGRRVPEARAPRRRRRDVGRVASDNEPADGTRVTRDSRQRRAQELIRRRLQPPRVRLRGLPNYAR